MNSLPDNTPYVWIGGGINEVPKIPDVITGFASWQEAREWAEEHLDSREISYCVPEPQPQPRNVSADEYLAELNAAPRPLRTMEWVDGEPVWRDQVPGDLARKFGAENEEN